MLYTIITTLSLLSFFPIVYCMIFKGGSITSLIEEFLNSEIPEFNGISKKVSKALDPSHIVEHPAYFLRVLLSIFIMSYILFAYKITRKLKGLFN